MASHPHFPAMSLVLLTAAFLTTTLPILGAEAARTEQELRAFYQHTCAICHGPDGSAVTQEGRKLKGRDFTSQAAMRGSTDEALAKTIRQGLFFGMGMPAFKRDLTEQEALVLVRDIIRKARKGEPILAQAGPSELKRAQANISAGPR